MRSLSTRSRLDRRIPLSDADSRAASTGRTAGTASTGRTAGAAAASAVALMLTLGACGSDDSKSAFEEPVRPTVAPVVVNGGDAAPATDAGLTDAPQESAAPAADATAAAATEAPAAGEPVAAPEPPPGTSPVARPNPEVDPNVDALSTFALDVDTGSYTLARSYINGGTLPDPGAVRVEEFVNYFNQDYPQPVDGAAFRMSVDGMAAPFLRPDQRIVRVGVQGRSVDAGERPDANLTFVIDVSGSMADPNKLELVKPTLQHLVERLRRTDRVAIVTYSDDARVMLPSTPVSERDAIVGAIDRLAIGGSTYVESGVRLGYDEAQRAFDGERINRVVLLSDGVANIGETGPEGILGAIGDAARDGIDLVTVGFGMGSVNDPLMEQLADKGDGFYAYVDGQAEADRLFGENLTGSLLTIGKEAKAQVEFNPATVKTYRLVGFENRAVADEQFRDDSVDGGELGSGHTVTALYEVTVQEAPAAGAASWIARSTMRWLDPATSAPAETTAELRFADITATPGDANPRLAQDVFVAAFADHLRNGPWSTTLSAEALEQNLTALAGRLDDNRLVELAALVKQWRTLTGR